MPGDLPLTFGRLDDVDQILSLIRVHAHASLLERFDKLGWTLGLAHRLVDGGLNLLAPRWFLAND